MAHAQSTLERIERILPQLQSRQLELVLAFTEFVRTRDAAQSEDEVLWSFVEREQAYRAEHPEDIVLCDSDEELIAALEAVP